MYLATIVIQVPMHRVRGRRRTNVFAPFYEAMEFERAAVRLFWSSAVMTTLLGVALQLSLG